MKKGLNLESTWIFLTNLCHYNLSENVKILCMYYQKRSWQYTKEKNTFSSCEDLRVFWDLKPSLNTRCSHCTQNYFWRPKPLFLDEKQLILEKFHNWGIVCRRKLPDTSLTRIFNAVDWCAIWDLISMI